MNSSWEKCATEYDPDPDIAGIGVVTAFITASCLAILSISLYLAIARSGLNIIEAGNALRTYHEYSRTCPRELGLFRDQGAYHSGQTSQEVLGRGHDMDSDGTEAPIRLGSVTHTAYPA
ncbi:hypothetical protein FOBRF1_014846 [Fusarium oxysporum]